MSQQLRFAISYAGRNQDRLVAFSGEENIWDLYQLVATVGVDGNLDLAKIIRQSARIDILSGDGSVLRSIHGIITSAAFDGESRLKRFRLYRLTVEPELALLKRRRMSRIYQQQSAQAIFQSVMSEAGIESDRYRFNLQGSATTRDYCVQYNETDWDFIRRLCDEEGWYYYFESMVENAILVVTDHRGGHGVLNPKTVDFHEPSSQPGDRPHIYALRPAQAITFDTIALFDYSYSKPNLDLHSQYSRNAVGMSEFRYPGNLAEADASERAAKRRFDAQASHQQRSFAESNHARLQPGYEMTLQGDGLDSHAKDYFVTAVVHKAEQPQALEEEAASSATKYQNQLTMVPADIAYRNVPRVAKPSLSGYQTARVVGPEGEPIYTDEHGRIKVRFHWDPSEKTDEHNSCWLRVMQSWAGSAYGSFALPRVGQEVVVSFENGDPDRPLVTGTVYNGTNRAPLDLPAQKTQTMLRTRLVGGEGFNEIKLEDLAEKAGISIESAKDWTRRVSNDSKTFIGNDQHLIVVKDQLETVEGEKHQTIKGDYAKKIDKTLSLDITQDLQMKTGGDSAFDAKEFYIYADKFVLDGADEISLKSGGNFVKLDSSGVTIKGTMIKLNEGGSAGRGRNAKVLPVKIPANADESAKTRNDQSKTTTRQFEAGAIAVVRPNAESQEPKSGEHSEHKQYRNFALHIEIPSGTNASTKFILSDDNGEYRQEKSIADDVDPNNDTLDLLFEKLPIPGNYTLSMEQGETTVELFKSKHSSSFLK